MLGRADLLIYWVGGRRKWAKAWVPLLEALEAPGALHRGACSSFLCPQRTRKVEADSWHFPSWGTSSLGAKAKEEGAALKAAQIVL